MNLLHMSSLGTLLPGGPWCVFYAKRHQLYWGLTYNVAFCWYSDLISHKHIHTLKDTQYTQGPVDWHIHINIYLHHLLCAHNSYLYYTEWIIYWYQKFTFHNALLFKIYSFLKVIYLLIRWCYKTRFFLWNTNNIDRNSVNKQNTHTHTKHSYKDNTGKG